ncbi:ribonuclease P protein component [Texas Phoenix palm phytoplasma]|uniref:Ribonuclease P protein component n=1 Tax=Texas Phoenix palm phytoplasma TaxID=176709 RepID=A0ABS5BIN5_9MOLU|nr:ribonuclease P protein component [Texas Phoenix palm phytoplasma]MBP3059455.1 ribonuclease P protein component [Texas Phoenix palm phytoplasma]
MKRKFILKKKKEINFIFKFNKCVRNYFFLLYYVVDTDLDYFRFALSIGKKYGKSHERNLIKRRLRMIIHENSSFIKKNISFVIVIKPVAKQLNFLNLKKNVLFLLKKSFLINLQIKD